MGYRRRDLHSWLIGDATDSLEGIETALTTVDAPRHANHADRLHGDGGLTTGLARIASEPSPERGRAEIPTSGAVAIPSHVVGGKIDAIGSATDGDFSEMRRERPHDRS